MRRKFVGDSPQVELVRQLALRAAHHNEPVLVLGDTGTGKEVVARIIHEQGPRRKRTFVAVNCGAIPRELLESELFGAEAGAYTDLKERKTGLWQTAHRGTLFLDEVADLALHHQVKILRTLEEGVIRPLGATAPVRVDVRVVAATNRDLFARIESGEFREDLYYRLRSSLIRTPPLRDHPEDIPGLADFFWRKLTGDEKASLGSELHDDLRTYRWPGNARELRMVLANLHALFGGAARREHLRAIFEFEGQARAAGSGPVAGRARKGAPSPGDLALHWVECLRHLREVDEVLRAWRVAIRPAVRGRRPDAEALGTITDVSRRHLHELHILSLRPLLFHSESLFSAVRSADEALRDFQATLESDLSTARSRWKGGLERELDLTHSALFREVERILTAKG